MLKTKPTPKVASFSLYDSADYASAAEKATELRASLTELEREEDSLRDRLRERPATPAASNRKVAALLGDEVNEADPMADGIHGRLAAIAGEKRDLRAAIQIAEQRQAAARLAASKEICEQLKPEHDAALAALARALVAAHAAHKAREDLRHRLQAADLSWTGLLSPDGARHLLGDVRDNQGALARFLRDRVREGLIQADEIPEELR